jgi:hypothetical protein
MRVSPRAQAGSHPVRKQAHLGTATGPRLCRQASRSLHPESGPRLSQPQRSPQAACLVSLEALVLERAAAGTAAVRGQCQDAPLAAKPRRNGRTHRTRSTTETRRTRRTCPKPASLPSLPSLVSLCAAMVRPVRKLGGNVCFAMPWRYAQATNSIFGPRGFGGLR